MSALSSACCAGVGALSRPIKPRVPQMLVGVRFVGTRVRGPSAIVGAASLRSATTDADLFDEGIDGEKAPLALAGVTGQSPVGQPGLSRDQTGAHQSLVAASQVGFGSE